jgi:hypothetical protein
LDFKGSHHPTPLTLKELKAQKQPRAMFTERLFLILTEQH